MVTIVVYVMLCMYMCVYREEILERFERAAAIAVFQGNIIMANISLREGAVSANSKGQKLQGITLYIGLF